MLSYLSVFSVSPIKCELCSKSYPNIYISWLFSELDTVVSPHIGDSSMQIHNILEKKNLQYDSWHISRGCYNLSIRNEIFLVKESSLYWMLYLDILEVIVTRVLLKIFRVSPKTSRSWPAAQFKDLHQKLHQFFSNRNDLIIIDINIIDIEWFMIILTFYKSLQFIYIYLLLNLWLILQIFFLLLRLFLLIIDYVPIYILEYVSTYISSWIV